MAGPDFPLIDRRRLLAVSAAMATASIAPRVTPGAAKAIQQARLFEKPALNLSANMIRRLAQIEKRNALRQGAGLPLLKVVRELRRMKACEYAQDFEQFAATHEKEIWGQVLKNRREKEGNPNWRPRTLFEGVRYQREVRNVLREKFLAARGVQRDRGT